MTDIKRPTLTPGKWQERVDGSFIREFMYADGFTDTLMGDEWKDKTPAEQTAEMDRRYDNWYTLSHLPQPEPTAAELDQQLRDAERAALDAQMRVLDIKDKIAIANQPVTDDETIVDEVIEN